MTVRLSKHETIKFVKLYKKYDCLWNTCLVNYKNRHVRNIALCAISDQMGIIKFGPREVAQKIKHIRTTYNQELKKIVRSKSCARSEDQIYKPKLPWFDILHSVFEKQNQYRTAVLNFTEEENLDDEDETVICEPYETLNVDNLNPLVNTSHIEVHSEEIEVYEKLPSIIKSEDEFTYEDSQNQDTENTGVQCDLPNKETQNLKMYNFSEFFQNSEDNNCESQLNSKPSSHLDNAIDRLEDVVEKASLAITNEYDSFATFVALALKGLPPENAITAQRDILEVITREKRKALKLKRNL